MRPGWWKWKVPKRDGFGTALFVFRSPDQRIQVLAGQQGSLANVCGKLLHICETSFFENLACFILACQSGLRGGAPCLMEEIVKEDCELCIRKVCLVC